MIKKLPLYKALIDDENAGMYAISLVDDPAVEFDWLAFEKQEEELKFKVENEEKHIIRGVIMAANKPIYRISPTGYEYYIQFDAETIRLMAQKYLADGFQNNVDTQHNNKLEDGVFMVQWFIKDTENGINPKGFEAADDGSLFAEFKVENEEIWNQIKEGTFKGFSLAGFFDVEEIENPAEDEEEQEVLALIEKIRSKINK